MVIKYVMTSVVIVDNPDSVPSRLTLGIMKNSSDGRECTYSLHSFSCVNSYYQDGKKRETLLLSVTFLTT
jgi:hypothetical protein